MPILLRNKINNIKDFLEAYPEMEDLIVDATEQKTQRPKRKQKAYYSGKKKCHTLKNQIVVNKNGQIIDVTESYPGRQHDKKIWDKSKISRSLPSKIPIMGDSGYQGIQDDFPNATLPRKKRRGGPKLSKKQKGQNRKISRERIVVENVIGDIKFFKILSERYRGLRKKHAEIFRIIAYLTNIKFRFVN